jgi:hypothetical protein
MHDKGIMDEKSMKKGKEMMDKEKKDKGN